MSESPRKGKKRKCVYVSAEVEKALLRVMSFYKCNQSQAIEIGICIAGSFVADLAKEAEVREEERLMNEFIRFKKKRAAKAAA